jgi:hypothetical protein
MSAEEEQWNIEHFRIKDKSKVIAVGDGTGTLLRTPNGIPEGWYVTVEEGVPVLHKVSD